MVIQGTLEQAEQLLLRDEEQNRYPLLRLEQGGVGVCWVCGGSLCLWDKNHNKYVYAVQAADELQELYATVRGRGGMQVALLTDAQWLETALAMEDGLQGDEVTQLRAAPFAGAPSVVPGVTFGPVTREVAEWMLMVYQHPELSVDFIMRRAQAAPAVAAFYEGRPVGFFITHSGAELGPVYTDPAFRGRGLADALYAQMADRLPKNQRAPVLFVFPGNHASQKWLRRLGCVPAPRPVAWFWRGSRAGNQASSSSVCCGSMGVLG